MQRSTNPQVQLFSASVLTSLMLSAAVVLAASPVSSQAAPDGTSKPAATVKHHVRPAKKTAASQQIAQAPAPPPMPHWPINDAPNPPSVVWDAGGLRINASNSSLQQILNEVSTDTGTKVVGSVSDQRVYGSYGPGDARDVLSELLLGSGYNVLLSGDLGHGAPKQIVLTPRRAGPVNAPNAANRPQQDPDDEIPEQPEDEPQPQVQQPPVQPEVRPGFGPNGPMRTPQQVMEEMQQRQLLQQQQMQQQMQQQQQNNQTAPQQNPQ